MAIEKWDSEQTHSVHQGKSNWLKMCLLQCVSATPLLLHVTNYCIRRNNYDTHLRCLHLPHSQHFAKDNNCRCSWNSRRTTRSIIWSRQAPRSTHMQCRPLVWQTLHRKTMSVSVSLYLQSFNVDQHVRVQFISQNRQPTHSQHGCSIYSAQ
jgi:hypothetical protein